MFQCVCHPLWYIAPFLRLLFRSFEFPWLTLHVLGDFQRLLFFVSPVKLQYVSSSFELVKIFSLSGFVVVSTFVSGILKQSDLNLPAPIRSILFIIIFLGLWLRHAPNIAVMFLSLRIFTFRLISLSNFTRKNIR